MAQGQKGGGGVSPRADIFIGGERRPGSTPMWVGAVWVQHIWGPPVWTRTHCAYAAFFNEGANCAAGIMRRQSAGPLAAL